MSLTIGEISYTNILPMFFYINREYLKSKGCTFIPKVPSGLNEGMKKGTIDVGGISSFAFGEASGQYQLMPGLSVSSYGKVGSIFLFSHKPLQKLEGASIALTSSSATSVHLLKIIMAEFYNHSTIHYTIMAPDPAEMKKNYDAFLLIGDDAIQTSWKNKSDLYCYDLGELWLNHTGYPMTYAVFAVRKEAVQEKESVLKLLYKEFLYSKKRVLYTHLKEMTTSIKKEHGGTQDFWINYFRSLHYDFQEKEKESLLYYYNLMYKHGYFSEPVNKIDMWLAGNEVQYLF
ncbi:menaquinone biosynthesis protein [Alteribacillus bidgolensis]|uniref:Chorismate dehydratase n=1 Tax=Alteribacillus bidgolensis TaxID=930129 RepID=A0A1G8C4U4_9BACI|nr:menaquinone biosynthesis protein [Alteribacillus bidgolensis]SDH40507.1 futalosine synthase [Alteribacillus bidgolensis]